MVEPAMIKTVGVEELQTRFLYPFFFRRNVVAEAVEALANATIAGESIFWTLAPPPQFYGDELLPHVAGFLFPQKDHPGCGYLRVSDAAVDRLFHNAVLRSPHGDMPLKPVSRVGCEIFLTEQGVGVLSIALSPKSPRDGALTQDAAKEFNYLLARHHRYSRAFIRIPHVTDDPERLKAIPQEARDQFKPPPPNDASVDRRLGIAGGQITTGELAKALIAPLLSLGHRSVQHGLSLYTVARFGPQVDFGSPGARGPLGPFLASLAQVEEPSHAGPADDDLGVNHAVLNRRHWAAVGQMGSAHLLTDQVGSDGLDVPFNHERVARVRDKYFIAYLLGLLQRMALHRALADAAEITSHSAPVQDHGHAGEAPPALTTPSPQIPHRLVQLRDSLMAFAVGGHFTQVSSREAVHRFYRLSREGLDVAPAWAEVRRAISDMESKHSIERERDVARSMAKSLTVVANVQAKVEWIECFIISVYVAELCNIAFEAMKEGVLPDWFKRAHFISVFAAAAIGLVVSLCLLKPWKHTKEHSHE